jgi:NAD(P)-dependent dehydrogenase (short-subunit alcohol dehydrogenase family)
MTSDRKLDGRVALVTGGGSGIGKAACMTLAAHGASVGVLDVAPDAAAATALEIEQAGGRALALGADVSQAAPVAAAYATLVERFERLDIVFANAGINGVWAPVHEIEAEEWDRTHAVNLKGTFLTIKYAVPYLKQRGGSVIVTSSINGTRTFSSPGASAYASSKAGQLALAKSLAFELAPHRIRVNVICPGTVKTAISWAGRNVESIKYKRHAEPRVPLGGAYAEPPRVADAVLFLASEESSHITGTPIWIDGGESLLWG